LEGKKYGLVKNMIILGSLWYSFFPTRMRLFDGEPSGMTHIGPLTRVMTRKMETLFL